jgi:GTP1/Obg family GTP-binding protein
VSPSAEKGAAHIVTKNKKSDKANRANRHEEVMMEKVFKNVKGSAAERGAKTLRDIENIHPFYNEEAA